jgi:CspA family cold shock protein
VAESEIGTIKWFNADKGFGFILRENESDIFVHRSALADPTSRSLEEGQKVEFTVTKSDKGLQAQDVKVVE